MTTNAPLQVNIRDVIASKNEKILKWIPGFIISWFERFVHQADLNFILRKHHDEDGIEFAKSVIHELGTKVKVVNLDNIPKNGRCVMVANHPMAGLDALCLFGAVGEVRSDISLIANDILAHIPQFKKYFIPVNKLGKSPKEAMLRVDEAYKLGGMMMVFPAGLCSRKIDGKIVDLDWQKSFLIKAIQYDLQIIPVHINGANSNRFYRIANWRKFFGLKFNIEMMTLADELFKQKDKELVITVGKPLSPTVFSKQKAVEDAQKIKRHVYKLSQDPSANFEY
jgi:putative hemolysin